MGPIRIPYSQDEDALLVKYIATYNPEQPGRLGNELYKHLVENADGKWNWSKRHSWQSWRDRYKKNEPRFNSMIKKYQEKKRREKEDQKLEAAHAETDLNQREPANGQSKPSTARRSKGEDIITGPSSSQPPKSSPARVTQTNAAHASYTKAERADFSSDEDDRDRKDIGSHGHNHIARKTARKTAVVYSDEEVDDADRASSDLESTAQKKRKLTEGSDANGDAKRQRTQNNLSTPRSTGKVLDGSPTVNGTSGPKSIPNGHHQAESLFASGRLPSTVINGLDILLAVNGPEKLLNGEGVQKAAFKALQLNDEQQQAAIEYVRSRLPEPIGTVAGKNKNSRERLYPQLSEEDDANSPTRLNNVPGAWDNSPHPNADMTQMQGHQQPQRPESATATPIDAGQAQITVERAGSTVDDFQREPGLALTVKGDVDFFQTPSPEQPSTPQQPRPIPSSTRAQDEREEGSNATVVRSTLPQRDPPRYASGTFSNSFVSSSGRRLSRKRAPDVDSSSDTEIIEDETTDTRRLNMPNIQDKSWPPLRTKRSAENEDRPVPEPTPAQRSSEKPQNASTSGTSLKDASPSKLIWKEVEKPERLLSSPVKRTVSETPRVASRSVKDVPGRNAGADHHVQIDPKQVYDVGSSRIRAPALPTSSQKRPDRTDPDHDWRSAKTVSHAKAPSVASTSTTDPFLTSDHANRLRKVKRGKGKEVVLVNADAKANRRTTFGGFPTHQVPEIDLRKTAVRSSFTGNPRTSNTRQSLSSESPSSDVEHDPDQSMRRRTSVTATVDLSLELPGPDVQLDPTDQARINSAGLQFFIKSMAKNHGISEEWVWNIFRERKSLEATDRILAEMQMAAKRACLEAMERDGGRKDEGNMMKITPASQGRPVSRSAIHERAESAGHEIDLSAVTTSGDRSLSRRRRSQLQYTPGDEDPTLARLREQYAPPSASRAARYMRARARRSSGMMSSPLNPSAEYSRRFDDDDEDEEKEVMMALTPGRLLDNFAGPADSTRAVPSSPLPPASDSSGLLDGTNGLSGSQQPWTAEEDRVILDGEDGDAIKGIMKRRGRMAVKWRLVELADEGVMS